MGDKVTVTVSERSVLLQAGADVVRLDPLQARMLCDRLQFALDILDGHCADTPLRGCGL